jgi:hypothetical protein
MRVSINAADGTVVVDGVPGKSDCRELLDQGISAVQWYGSKGEVEYVGHAKPNMEITSFATFQTFVDRAEMTPAPEPPPPPEPLPNPPPDPTLQGAQPPVPPPANRP